MNTTHHTKILFLLFNLIAQKKFPELLAFIVTQKHMMSDEDVKLVSSCCPFDAISVVVASYLSIKLTFRFHMFKELLPVFV